MSRYDLLLPRNGPRSIVDPTGADRPIARGEQTRGPGFDEILAGEVGGSVKLSAHAQERLRTRGIELSGVDLERIGQAMDRIARKGGRESLLLGEKAAFVVSVPNRTVITAIPHDELRSDASRVQVFTNIDSAALM